jgi:hypothetical protein
MYIQCSSYSKLRVVDGGETARTVADILEVAAENERLNSKRPI